MCGIAGCLDLNNREISEQDRKTIDRMLEKIKHRGPNDKGVCGIGIEQRFIPRSTCMELDTQIKGILGFNRLSIQDVSEAGHQPMLSDDKKVAITFNGEIYNTEELKEHLEKKFGITSYKGHSDTEIILQLYLAYGFDKMIQYLNGMFAIVLYDARLDKMYMARDRFGIIPIHYIQQNRKIYWASEIKAFQAVEDFKREYNIKALSKSWRYCYPNDALLENVVNIEPGTYVTFDPQTGTQQLNRYFELNDLSIRKKDYSLVDIDIVLENCVKRQLISDVNVGVQFSGGVDSTLLAKYVIDIYKTRGEKMLGFSLVNRKKEIFSEEKYINHAAKQIDLELLKCNMDEQVFISNFEKSMYAFERFINIPSPIGIYEFSKYAKDYITVLISGEGADEVCGGYGGFISSKIVEDASKVLCGCIPRKWRKYDTKSNLTEFLNSFDAQCSEVSCENAMQDFELSGVLEERLEWWNSFNGTVFDKMRKLYFKEELVSLLERQNKVCMANSVENRVPFLDNEFVECMFAIPEKDLLHRQYMNVIRNRGHIRTAYEGKYALKQLSEQIYGKEFAFRKKQAIRVPLSDYLLSKKVQEYMHELVLDGIKDRGILNYSYIEECMNHLEREENAMVVWKALNTEIWFQLFIDGRLPISFTEA